MVKVDIIGKSNHLNRSQVEQIIQSDLGRLSDLEQTSMLEISFVSPAEIQKLNDKFRNNDKPTDVLSFPVKSIPGDENSLGSITICEEYMEGKSGETAELIRHGLLHLLGFDHEVNIEKWRVAAKSIDHNMI